MQIRETYENGPKRHVKNREQTTPQNVYVIVDVKTTDRGDIILEILKENMKQVNVLFFCSRIRN